MSIKKHTSIKTHTHTTCIMLPYVVHSPNCHELSVLDVLDLQPVIEDKYTFAHRSPRLRGDGIAQGHVLRKWQL